MNYTNYYTVNGTSGSQTTVYCRATLDEAVAIHDRYLAAGNLSTLSHVHHGMFTTLALDEPYQPPIAYEEYRRRVLDLVASTAPDAAAQYNDLERQYPEYAQQLATELCAEESREREWEF